jgi:hypothetical protein
MLINMIVVLPAVQPPEPDVHFDSQGVLTPTLPYWFPQLRTHRYSQRVVRAVEAALPWFDERSTPAACLRLLESHENNGPQRGDTWSAMRVHLSALV